MLNLGLSKVELYTKHALSIKILLELCSVARVLL